MASQITRIIHLDDHTLFQRALMQCLRWANEEFLVEQYQDSNSAFESITHLATAHEPLNLIITDLVHPGQDGYEFAKSVREFQSLRSIRTPIVLLSMYSPEISPIVQRGLDERVFDAFLPKNLPCTDLQQTIEQLTRMTFRKMNEEDLI